MTWKELKEFVDNRLTDLGESEDLELWNIYLKSDFLIRQDIDVEIRVDTDGKRLIVIY